MAKYKIVFSDIDGTLLNSNHQITRGTLESVQKLQQNGIPFVLVSARMPRGIVPLLEELKINAPIICFSGALVLGPVQKDGTREVLSNKSLNSKDVKEIYTLVAERFSTISFSAYNEDNWLVTSQGDEWVIQERLITGTHPQPFHLDDDIHQSINKIMCMGSPHAIEALERELKEHHPELTIYKSKPTYLEIMAQHVKKSAAIEELIKLYRVTKEEIIALGDNFNDIDMLRYAGLGVAMGNAPDEVKLAAEIVTLSNDEDGVKLILEKYC